MTVSASVVKLEDGPRNAVFHLYAEIGGGDSEFNVKKVDVTTLSFLRGPSIGQPCTHLSLEKIQFNTVFVAVKLEWESSLGTHARIWTMAPNFSEKFDFHGSPINNNAPSRTGNVLLSTLAGDPDSASPIDGRYDIIAWFRKAYE
jgi:hypothetical protein